MADRIFVEISGSSKDLQKEALAAVASIKGVRAEVKRSDTDVRRSATEHRKLALSIGDVNQRATLLRNTIALIKWPAMIAGAGGAAQALAALGAGAVGLGAALAPLSGTLAAYPALLGAMAQGMTTWKLASGDLQKALGGDEKALKALTPEARRFADTLKDLKPRLGELRSAAGAGLFAGLDRGLSSAMKNFDVLKVIVRETGGAMGAVAAEAGKLLGSKAFGKDLAAIGKQNATTIERMGRAGINLGSALRHVMVAAGPFIDWLTKGTLHFARFIDEEAKAARESGRLADFFDETRKTMQLLWPILRDGAGALLNIGKAAKPLGDDILRALGGAAKGWRQWTESVQGQNALQNYFTNAKPGIFETGRLVRDLTTMFFRLGAQPGVAELIRRVRVDLLPVLEDVIASTTEAFGPHLISMLVSVVRLMGDLAGANGPLVFLVDTIRLFADALHALFTEVPGLKQVTIEMTGMLAVMKVGSLAAKAFGIKKIAEAWRGVGTAAKGAAAAEAGAGAAGAAGGAAAGGAAAGAAGGAAAATGIRGFMGKLKPLAKQAGLIGLGYAALQGMTEAFSDENATLTAKGRIGASLRSFFGGIGPDLTKEANRAVASALKNIGAGAGFTAPVRKRSFLGLDALAKDQTGLKFVSGQIKRELRSLEAAFANARRTGAFGGLRQQIEAFGRSHPQFTAAVNRMLRDLDRLKRGQEARFAPNKIAFNFGRALQKDGVDVGKATQNLLRQIDKLPPGARKSAVGMTRAMVNELRRNKVITGAQAAQIKKSIAGHIEETDRRSRRATGRLVRQAERDMQALQFAIKAGIVRTMSDLNQALEAIGLKPIGFNAKGQTTVGGKPAKPLKPIKDMKPKERGGLINRARGGLHQYGAPGESGRDSIVTHIAGQGVVVGPGEVAAVLTRHQQRELNGRLADVGGLPGFFQKNDKPHYMARGGIVRGMARGGYVQGAKEPSGPASGPIRAFARKMFAKGFSVTSGGEYRGSGTNHDAQKAVDWGNSVNDMARLWNTIWPQKNDFLELFGPESMRGAPSYRNGVAGSAVPGHEDHIHTALGKAMAGALGKLAGGMGGEAKKLARVVLSGPDGPLRDLGQAALDKVRKGAQKKLDGAAADAGGGDLSGFSGGGSNTANMALGRKMAKRMGWTGAEWGALKELWTRESGWSNVMNREGSGATGIPQALPGSKMASEGADWRTNPATQIAWGLKYIKGRYGSPSKALAFHSANNWYEQGGMIGGDGASILDFLPHAAKGRAPKGQKFKPGRQKRPRIRHGKGRPFKPQRIKRQKPGTVAEASFEQLGKFVEDQTSLFGDDQRNFQLDDILSPDELNKLLGRAGGIRGAIARQLELLGGRIVPEASKALAAAKKKVADQVTRVKKLVARLKRIRQALDRIKEKKKPTRRDRKRAEDLRNDAKSIHKELARLTGVENPNPNRLGDVAGAIGESRQVVTDRQTTLTENSEQLRPSQLPASLRDWDYNIAELKRTGATKPEKPDNAGETAELMREQLAASRRSLAVSQSQFQVLRDFAPLVGRYAHGTRHVPETGLALVHRGERISPDPKGAYGSQLVAQRAGPVNVTVLFKGQAPSYNDVEVLVDGKLQKFNRDVTARARQLRAGPGR